MGEPAGIGPELTVKAKQILKDKFPFFVIGNYKYLSSIADQNCLKTKKINHFTETFNNLDKLCIFDQQLPEPVKPGEISSKNSAVVPKIIKRAVSFVNNNEALAIVTNPINKWALKQNRNFPYEGHTDFLASLDSLNNPSVMMLANNFGFKVVPVTVHIPVSEISTKLTKELLETTICIVNQSLKNDFNIKRPRIVILGLNPHAGENSTIGSEEKYIIQPAITKLKNAGLQLIGPLSADTAFTKERRQQYDVCVCMYHDQALIPIKTISFDRSINITIGLSFVRTSPDHGTALDIAGKNIASPQSLILAIKQAKKIAKVRQKNAKGN